MKQALIIIDLIEDIIGEAGRLNTSAELARLRKIIPLTNQATSFARDHDIQVIWVRVGFEDDYHDMPSHSLMFNAAKKIHALKINSFGCQWVKGLNQREQDLYMVKRGISAFAGNDLDHYLKENEIEHIVIGGVSSALAIESTARLAHDLDYQVTILEDLCAAPTLTLHEQSMLVLERIATIQPLLEWERGLPHR